MENDIHGTSVSIFAASGAGKISHSYLDTSTVQE